MATPTLWGTQFQVNTAMGGTQQQPHVASLADGRMVVAWNDQGASNTTLKFKILNADGSLSVAEQVLNTGQTAGGNMGFGQSSKDYLAITGLTGGGFAVAWSLDDFGANGEEIYYAVFNSNGAMSVDGIRTANGGDTVSQQDDPDIVATSDGGFTVAWDSNSGQSGQAGVWSHKFNAAGTSLGADLKYFGTGSSDPAIAAHANGDIVYVNDDSIAPINLSPEGIYGYDETSNTFFRTDQGRNWNNATGDFNSLADVAVLANDTIVSVYWDYGLNPNINNVFMSFGAGSSAVQVNTSAVGSATDPSIVALPAGGFLVVWNAGKSTPGGTVFDVLGQLYDSSGTKDGTEFVITSPATAFTALSSLEAVSLGDGRVLVSWEGAGVSGQGAEIYAQIVETRSAGVTMNGLNSGQQQAGTHYNDTINGNDGNDVLFGAGGVDTLNGDAGFDTLSGGAGGDTLNGGTDGDVLDGGDGDDTLNGGTGDDVLRGESGIDTLNGDAGSDTLRGGASGDTLNGGADGDVLDGGDGDDAIDGGTGNDYMSGGIGNDIYHTDSFSDFVFEAAGQGTDSVRTSLSNVTLGANLENLQLWSGPSTVNFIGTGNELNNEIIGWDGNDRLSGMAGNDVLLGWDGSDTLTGGLGKDRLTGGGGSAVNRDVFDFNSKAETGKTAATRDVITDFRHLVDDIDIRGIDASSKKAGNQNFVFIAKQAFHQKAGELHYKYAGASTIVEGDTNGDGQADFQIQLSGRITLTKADFIL
ncbi:MAG: calcium-binding protein [Hyphomicrobium sp.]